MGEDYQPGPKQIPPEPNHKKGKKSKNKNREHCQIFIGQESGLNPLKSAQESAGHKFPNNTYKTPKIKTLEIKI